MRIKHDKKIKDIIVTAYPEFYNIEIKSVEQQGHNNLTYKINGDKILRIKIPNTPQFIHSITNEYKYLPILQKYISYKLPIGEYFHESTKECAYYFLINKYIEGDHYIQDRTHLVNDICNFFIELHNIPIIDDKNLLPCKNNFYRGAHPIIYEQEFFEAIVILRTMTIFTEHEINKIVDIWLQARNTVISSATWVHGDMALTNLIFQNSRLFGVIDFGQMNIGDPACDLIIGYTLLNQEEYIKFKDKLYYLLGKDVWLRGKAWTLWKMLLVITHMTTWNPHWLNATGTIKNVLYWL